MVIQLGSDQTKKIEGLGLKVIAQISTAIFVKLKCSLQMVTILVINRVIGTNAKIVTILTMSGMLAGSEPK